MADFDWASLPKELLGLIAKRIVHIEDFIVFGTVCKPWQSAIILEEKPASPPMFPWLMLAAEDEEHSRCFFNIFSSKLFEFNLPEASGRKCLAINFGWLLTIGIDLQIKLLHPFSRHQINLPPQPTFTLQYTGIKFREVLPVYVRKATASCSPPPFKHSKNQNSCVIMTIYGEYSILAFARLGDKSWTDIRAPSRSYDDIVYYNGQFYAVDCHGVVVVCDIDNNEPRATVIAPAPAVTHDSLQKYLVESSGDLLLISRIRGGLYYSDEGITAPKELLENEKMRYYTVGFSILKMEIGEEGANEYPYHWVEVKSLGDQALFLGNNSSVSLSASSKEENNNKGCFFMKANCVYFTDDNVEFFPPHSGGGYDMGVFNLEDGTVQRHYTGPSRSLYSPPLWYI